LGGDEVKLVRENYGWSHEPFTVPEEVRRLFADASAKGKASEAEWLRMMARYRQAYPELAVRLEQSLSGQLAAGWDKDWPVYETGKSMATRSASGDALNEIAKRLSFFLGGSADLASSNKTTLKNQGVFHAEDYSGRNIWFGVREHAMGAALNGMALHGGLRVFGGTFFVFSDYLRPAIRLSALMKLPVIYVLTHDSIAVGEDGPTHEPIEQLPSLRAMPGLITFRPADGNETLAAYRYALNHSDAPVAMVLTRQNLPVITGGTADEIYEQVSRGAYIVKDTDTPQAILLATGSEVSLALDAQRSLAEEGIHVRVVSMPSWELFERQPDAYKQQVLPPAITARLSIEMARPLGWERYTGLAGRVIGIDTFGASAPGEKVVAEYGFTVAHVVAETKRMMDRS
jgi:transketolase